MLSTLTPAASHLSSHPLLRLFLIAFILSTSSLSTLEASHIRHQRSNLRNLHHHHSNNHFNPSHTGQLPIGEICQSDVDCANSSICISKMFEDDLELNVCQCEHRHMNRVNHSCFVKAGHKCYYPDKDPHGRVLYNCMEGLHCKSGMNQSDIHGGYCMCPDYFSHTDDPHRFLNLQYETHRCSATSLQFSKSALMYFGITLFWFLI